MVFMKKEHYIAVIIMIIFLLVEPVILAIPSSNDLNDSRGINKRILVGMLCHKRFEEEGIHIYSESSTELIAPNKYVVYVEENTKGDAWKCIYNAETNETTIERITFLISEEEALRIARKEESTVTYCDFNAVVGEPFEWCCISPNRTAKYYSICLDANSGKITKRIKTTKTYCDEALQNFSYYKNIADSFLVKNLGEGYFNKHYSIDKNRTECMRGASPLTSKEGEGTHLVLYYDYSSRKFKFEGAVKLTVTILDNGEVFISRVYGLIEPQMIKISKYQAKNILTKKGYSSVKVNKLTLSKTNKDIKTSDGVYIGSKWRIAWEAEGERDNEKFEIFVDAENGEILFTQSFSPELKHQSAFETSSYTMNIYRTNRTIWLVVILIILIILFFKFKNRKMMINP